MDLLKRRKRLTEVEVRFYMLQLIDACSYLHRKNIIHRDLKLGNLLLDSNLNIKLADFGLAIQLQTDSEKRTTICGTPNYIAPEVLKGKKGGHSFEVDVWSLGCIMYTLLCGKPPFETSKLENTYLKIAKTKYSFPDNIELSIQAKSVISKMLVKSAEKRPTMEQLKEEPFFRKFVPASLPYSALTTAPAFSHKMDDEFKMPQPRRRSVDHRKRRMDSRDDRAAKRRLRSSSSMEGHLRDIHKEMERSCAEERRNSGESSRQRKFGERIKKNLSAERLRHLGSDSKPVIHASPKVWVLCWLPCKRYGLGYVLSNNCFGVHFNDSSKIILQPDRRSYCYF